ncbi:IclR family transcriptional regulator [Halosolutus amylolyticus]|uniref:IclR family transcriptional regulator n=1 Tax=Halosolutus amylolyticus TaxID=2932267 RepID=A0ABD5PPA8_9EURY|nr:IclR family transcriptional regulator [Halosolutus amylolyticus]
MTDNARSGNHDRIKSVSVSLDIVTTLEQGPPRTITELADKLDRSPSNVLAHLRTLQERGFVVEEHNRYRPGLRYYEIGTAIREEYPLFVHGTQPADDLAADTGEFVWLMVEERGRGYYIYKSAGDAAVESGAYTMGSRWPLNASASGKVLLAHMDDTKAESVLDAHEMEQVTPNTITDRAELETELEQVREEGVARDHEESAVGIRGVAAPVQGLDGLIGAVAISGPASRIEGEYFHETLPRKIAQTADIIRIRYNGDAAVDG